MSNSHVQSAKAIAEDVAHLCCVPDDWRLQISNLAAWPLPTFCAKPIVMCPKGYLGHLRAAKVNGNYDCSAGAQHAPITEPLSKVGPRRCELIVIRRYSSPCTT